MKFSIPEDNIEALEKKLTRIRNKCAKYGCEYRYERVGDHYEEITFPAKNPVGPDRAYTETVHFIDIEVEGKAAVNGWRFAATLDFTDKGNIIHGVEGLEIPSRYYTCEPWCEHCQRSRGRRSSFIVFNEENGEFKQVGSSCLRDFTGGLSAENVAQFESFFKICEEASEYDISYSGGRSYFKTDDFLTVAAETIRIYGYAKRDGEAIPTASRAEDIYRVEYGMRLGVCAKEIREMYDEAVSRGLDIKRKESVELAATVKKWITENERDDNYFHNLKVACSLDYCDGSKIGLLVSSFPAYDRNLEMEAEKRDREAKEAEARAKSSWLGNVGDKVSFTVSDFRVISSWETQWGSTCVYKFVDTEGHECTWKTNNWVNDRRIIGATITGKVKGLNEYRGIKQTELTRCMVEYPAEKPSPDAAQWNAAAEKAIEGFLAAVNS